MAQRLSVALFLVKFYSMNFFDIPTSCPVVEGTPLRYSVGFYRGRRRTVIAWFADYKEAHDYLIKSIILRPYFKYDILKSMF